MRRIESQVSAGLAPQVQQEGAVHHGNRETAQALPLPDWLIVWSSLVVPLTEREGGQRRQVQVGWTEKFNLYLRGDATPEVGVERA